MKMNKLTLVKWAAVALAFGGVARAAESGGATAALAAPDRLIPAAPGTVTFTGYLGSKLDACIVNRLVAQDIAAVVRPYQAKTETGNADWRCEYWGKWYTSLALADAYRSSEATRAVRDEAAKALLATAAPDGYLGTRQPAHRLEGWDVWGCKYALLGVLAYYDRTHDPMALAAARHHADVLIALLGPGKANIADVGMWNGLPASSVLEPVVLLYQRTGDSKYLEFAKHIVAAWSQPSKGCKGGMRLVEDALAGKTPAHMCSPKAYEMMSCFEGLCELYRVTGQRDYLEASLKLAEGVMRQEATLIGCGTSNELWCDGARKQTGTVSKPMETCVTATWMKLEYQLLRLTGEVRHADELERNLYNGLISAMMPDGRWWAYFGHLMGVRVPSYVQHTDVNLSCCVVNGPRALMLTPCWAFMGSVEGPVVNLYAPGEARLATPAKRTVRLAIGGDYPRGERVDITVTPEQSEEFTLALRIPGWSEQTTLTVNGAAVAVQPGTYAHLRRTWQAGDRIVITFDMRGRLVEAPDGNGQIAIRRGPVVLALDNRLTPPAQGMTELDRSGKPFIALTEDPVAARSIGALMAFTAPCVSGGAAGKLTFCNYADAGNAFSQQNQFRTWLPMPLDCAHLYETGQNWNTLSHAPIWTDPPHSTPGKAAKISE
ncbi:MAG: beta-L-arabinofuranosidase domain-containing protein [Verrucomicrobiota bacterium]